MDWNGGVSSDIPLNLVRAAMEVQFLLMAMGVKFNLQGRLFFLYAEWND